MKSISLACLVSGVLTLGVSPAAAQGGAGFVRGTGGATFGTADAGAVVGGGFGIAVGPNVQIVGDFARVTDILPSEIRDGLDLISALISLEVGLPVSIDATAPAFLATGGVRFDVPARGRVRPFVEVQGGVARISFDLEADVAGIDISREVEEEADLESGSEFVVAAGGGVAIALTEAVGLDFGYRYHRIFTDDPAVNVNAVYASVRFVIP
jgi:opacity protein-like surface antigen